MNQIIESNTIIVTNAAQVLISATLDRMSVILSPEAAREWMRAGE